MNSNLANFLYIIFIVSFITAVSVLTNKNIENSHKEEMNAIMNTPLYNVQLRSYQIDVYDEHGTNDSIRIYDGDRLVGKVYALDSTAFNNIITKDNE